MKLACFSDVHAHNFSDFSKRLAVLWNRKTMRYDIVEPDDENPDIKEMNSRLYNILKGLCDIRDHCIKQNITEALFAGDLFHHRATIDVSVFNATYKVLQSYKTLGITIYAIAGNHDQVDNSTVPVSALHSMEDIVHVIEQPEVLELEDGTELVALPYSKDKDFILSNMQKLRDQCKNPNEAIMMCHLGINNAVVGSGMLTMTDEYTLKDLMYDKWKYVVVGHYHQPQLLEYNSFYCGTPVQNNFGDERVGEELYNGFFVIDTSKRYDVQFVPIIAPRFVTLSSAEDLENADESLLKENYVRIKANADDATQLQTKLDDMLGDEHTEVRLELEKDYQVDQRSAVSVTQSFADAVRTYAKEKWVNTENLDYGTKIGLDILSEAMNGGK